MSAYQVHRLKDTQRQQFRSAPHTSGLTIVKQKDYEAGTVVEAATAYAAWAALRDSEQPLSVGDIVESEGGELRICKFVGFEVAQWFVPDPPIPARVERIATQPEYTPPVIYSREQRARLVFAVEARPDAKDGARLRPGQPIDVLPATSAPGP